MKRNMIGSTGVNVHGLHAANSGVIFVPRGPLGLIVHTAPLPSLALLSSEH